MEILVILMLATVFFAIAMFIVSFIMVKKHHTDKVYEKGFDNLDLDDDDDEKDEQKITEIEVDENNDNFVKKEESIIVSDFEIEDTLFNEKSSDNVIDVLATSNVEEKTGNDDTEILIAETKEAFSTKKESESTDSTFDIIVPKTEQDDSQSALSNVKADMQEVVNVLINKKNYMFLANGNKVSKGEHIKLVLNKKIYFGLITKGNYMRDIRPLKNKPHKLIVIKNNKSKKEEIEVLDTSDLEFVPKRKSQN